MTSPCKRATAIDRERDPVRFYSKEFSSVQFSGGGAKETPRRTLAPAYTPTPVPGELEADGEREGGADTEQNDGETIKALHGSRQAPETGSSWSGAACGRLTRAKNKMEQVGLE